MLVTSEPNSGPTSRTPSILDSPTLARVERARLRLEASKQQQVINGSCGNVGTAASLASVKGGSLIVGSKQREDSLERSILDPKYSFLTGKIPIESITGPIKRGLLWQQRDRLFSRWKERYFILTRDYLHCFKRASGSATERISDMGQFIFKVKLVDVEKVEWLNRRSYSAVGLFLGREGRVLLRCDLGLEDWFELLDECTQSSKLRRQALRNIQGPRSRASLAAPPSHAALQQSGQLMGGTYSSALEDWLLTRHKTSNSINGHHGHLHHALMLSDSVPDLSGPAGGGSDGALMYGENGHSGISTNHSTPQRVPAHHHYYHQQLQHNHNQPMQHPLHLNNNTSRYSANAAVGYPLRQNGSYSSGFSGTPLRQQQKPQQQQQHNHQQTASQPQSPAAHQINGKHHAADDADGSDELESGVQSGGNGSGEAGVQLRRGLGGGLVGNGPATRRGCDNEKDEWLYRRPLGPNDLRHSLLTDIDVSACDSGLDTPPSTTHRPASCRDVLYMKAGARDSTDTGVSSSRGTLVSPGGSFRVNNNSGGGGGGSATNTALRYSSALQQQQQHQDKVLRNRNEIDRQQAALRAAVAQKLMAAAAAAAAAQDGGYDPNQNQKHFKVMQQQHQHQHQQHQLQHLQSQQPPLQNGNMYHSPQHHHHHHHQQQQQLPQPQLLHSISQNTGPREHQRYQHPALAALINDAQGKKFRDRSYSDIQQQPRRIYNNNSPSPRRRPFASGTPTRV